MRRLHKVDHKTGEHLEALPSFLIRAKKPPKVPPTTDEAAGAATQGSSSTATATAPAKRTKVQKDGEATPKAKTAKQKAAAAAVASSLDLDDTNARSFEPLPLDLQATSASIQQQCIDMNDVNQIQQLIPANDESFASIEDAHPNTSFSANYIKEEEPIHIVDDYRMVAAPSFKYDPATSSSFLAFINQSDMRIPKDTLLIPMPQSHDAANASSPFKHSARHPLSTNVKWNGAQIPSHFDGNVISIGRYFDTYIKNVNVGLGRTQRLCTVSRSTVLAIGYISRSKLFILK